MPLRAHRDDLERIYRRYTRREFAGRDPVQFIYAYEGDDLEIAAYVASALAYGRVAQIIRDVRSALERLGERPARRLRDATRGELARRFAGFRHRFTTGEDLAAALWALRTLARRRGSLQKALAGSVSRGDRTIVPALTGFTGELTDVMGRRSYLAVSPAGGSACKRLNLMLRWLVRRDAIDVGAWSDIDPALLVVPMDTHMHRLGRRLGVLRRRGANLRSAMEMTAAFARVAPDDPVKYDFALTRAGIDFRGELAAFGARGKIRANRKPKGATTCSATL